MKGFPKERGQQIEVSGSKPSKKSLFKRFKRGSNKSKGLANECNSAEDDDNWEEPSNHHTSMTNHVSSRTIGESSSSQDNKVQNDLNSPQSVSDRASTSSSPDDGLDQSSMNKVTDNEEDDQGALQSETERRPSISIYYDPSMAVITFPFEEEDPIEMPPEMKRFAAIRRQPSEPQQPRQNMIETPAACRRPTAFGLVQIRSQSEATVSTAQSTKTINAEVTMDELKPNSTGNINTLGSPTPKNDNRKANIQARNNNTSSRISLPPTSNRRPATCSPESHEQKNTLEVAVQKGILNQLQKSNTVGSSSSNESELAAHEDSMSMPRIAMQDMKHVDALYNDIASAMSAPRSDVSVETLHISGRPYVQGLPFTKDRITPLSNRSGVASRASSDETPITAPGRSKAYLLHEEAIQCRVSSSSAPTPTHSDHYHAQSNMNKVVPAPRLQPPNHNRLQQRQYQQHHQGSGRRFPQAMPPSRQRYHTVARQRPVVPRASSNAPICISVRRNVKVPLRRVPEVLKALSVQFYDTPRCPCCSRQVAVVADAAFLYCPHCTEISPLYGTIWPVGEFPEESECLRYGLGLGLTWGTMKKVFQEMYPRDYHHHVGPESKQAH